MLEQKSRQRTFVSSLRDCFEIILPRFSPAIRIENAPDNHRQNSRWKVTPIFQRNRDAATSHTKQCTMIAFYGMPWQQMETDRHASQTNNVVGSPFKKQTLIVSRSNRCKWASCFFTLSPTSLCYHLRAVITTVQSIKRLFSNFETAFYITRNYKFIL